MGELKKLKVGVIGLGFMGDLHANVYSTLSNVELVGIADKDPSKKELAKKYNTTYHDNYNDLLNSNVEAISICLPDRLHVDACCDAARSKKHILVEKPLAHDFNSAQKILDACNLNKVRLMVGHILRFDPRCVHLFNNTNKEDIGDLIHIRAKRATIVDVANRLGSNSSILYYLGVHDIDLIHWMSRSDIVSVYAKKVEKLHNGNEDSLYAILELSNGAIGLLDYCWSWPSSFPSGYNFNLEVLGTKSGSFIDVRDQGIWKVKSNELNSFDTHLWPEIINKITGNLKDELMHFTESLQNNSEFIQSPETASKAIVVIDAIFKSIKTNSSVKLQN